MIAVTVAPAIHRRRLVLSAAAGASLAAVPAFQAVGGRLGSALALLLVLPPLAAALAALGWRDRVAAALGRIGRPGSRMLAGYAAWAASSALLGLDVGVLIGASVALAMGRVGSRDRRHQLAAAIVGANVGSLLFPFSNLTNLVVVAGAGMAFGTYVSVALPAQLAAGAVAAVALLVRARSGGADDDAPADEPARGAVSGRAAARVPRTAAGLGAGAAAAGGTAAVVLGFAGGDPVVPLALVAGVAVAAAMLAGSMEPGDIVASWPRSGIAMVAGAALLAGPLTGIAGMLPVPADGPVGIIVAGVAGTLLSAVANNLPAALAGSLWLGASAPAVLVAYLVGTNIGALLTPHGSVATMLARSLAAADGEPLSSAAYVRQAWRYALPSGVAAVAAIIVVAR